MGRHEKKDSNAPQQGEQPQMIPTKPVVGINGGESWADWGSDENTKDSKMQLSEVKKTIVTVLGLIITTGTALAPAVTPLSPEAAAIIATVLGVATAILNYLVPNETTNPARAIGRSVKVKGEEPLPAIPAS